MADRGMGNTRRFLSSLGLPERDLGEPPSSAGVAGPTTTTEQSPTWTGFFPKGTIGVMPMASTVLGDIVKRVDVSVTPIAGPDGAESWTVSDQAPNETVAKKKDILSRTDLSNNKYSAADPRVVLIDSLVAKGVTPYALTFGQTYNDPSTTLVPYHLCGNRGPATMRVWLPEDTRSRGAGDDAPTEQAQHGRPRAQAGAG